MGRVVAGQLLHQKSKDMRRVAKCPLDWAEAAIVGSLVDLRDHIVQGSHQATGILSQSGVGWWNNVTARRVTWCRLSRIARRVCVCACPGLTWSWMPCSVHHSLIWSELHARCPSTCKTCIGPKCLVQACDRRPFWSRGLKPMVLKEPNLSGTRSTARSPWLTTTRSSLPAMWTSCPTVPYSLSSRVSLHLSPSLAGGVRLFECISSLHLSALICRCFVVGWGDRLSSSLYLSPFTCLPVRPVLFGSLNVSFYLFPFISLTVWLVSGSLDVSSLVSLHLSPTLSSGILLFRCLFFVFTCLSSGISRHVSPKFFVSQLICLQSAVCLSGGVRLYRLFTFARVSSTICLSPSVSYFICLRSHLSPILFVAVSSWFNVCFVFVSVLYSLCIFWFFQDKIRSHYGFCVLPLVSHLSPTLFSLYCLRYKWRICLAFATVWN